MENAQEASFLEGKFIRHLFTGRLHTKSRLWLSIMGLVGVALTMPLAVYAISFMEPAPSPEILMPANGGLSMLVEDILAVFDSCGIDGDALKTALALPLQDFEDAVQLASALAYQLDAIVTRDPDDFAGASLPIYSPADFLTRIAHE